MHILCQHNEVSQRQPPSPASFRNDLPPLQAQSSDFLLAVSWISWLGSHGCCCRHEHVGEERTCETWVPELLAGPRGDHLCPCHPSSFLSFSTPAILRTQAASRDIPRKIKERQHLPTPVFADSQQLPCERPEPRSRGLPWVGHGCLPVALCSSCKLTTKWYSRHSWSRNASITFLSNSAFSAILCSSPADHRQTKRPTLCHTDTRSPTLKPPVPCLRSPERLRSFLPCCVFHTEPVSLSLAPLPGSKLS